METNLANEIILYQPDDTLALDVRVEDESVWLTQAQMAELFQTTRNNITLHTRNIFKEGELEEISVCKESLLTAADGKRYRTKLYNLDVIISVGYRVKEHDRHLLQLDEKVDFFVRSSLQPKEGVFFNGQIFDAYALIANLIRQAEKRIVVIDNYIDDSVLVQLSKRKPGVTVDIYDGQISRQLRQDVDKHNEQYPGVALHKYTKSHDRFLIIDEDVYHIGASLKDLGRKLFAFSKMEVMTGSELLAAL